MNGAQALLKTLEAHGVTTIFGHPGGTIMPVYDALYDMMRPEHVERCITSGIIEVAPLAFMARSCWGESRQPEKASAKVRYPAEMFTSGPAMPELARRSFTRSAEPGLSLAAMASASFRAMATRAGSSTSAPRP